MKIKTKDLKKIFGLIIEKLNFEGVESVELADKDYYWLIGSPGWTYFEKQEKPEVGSLVDDWGSLKKLLTEKDRPTTYVDFDRVAAILRFISEKQNPVENEYGSVDEAN
jgi:hypothetical protein